MIAQEADEELNVALSIYAAREIIAEARRGSIEQVLITGSAWIPHTLSDHQRPAVSSRLVVRVPLVLHPRGVVVHAAISRIKMTRDTDVRAGEGAIRLSPTVRLALPSQRRNPD